MCNVMVCQLLTKQCTVCLVCMYVCMTQTQTHTLGCAGQRARWQADLTTCSGKMSYSPAWQKIKTNLKVGPSVMTVAGVRYMLAWSQCKSPACSQQVRAGRSAYLIPMSQASGTTWSQELRNTSRSKSHTFILDWPLHSGLLNITAIICWCFIPILLVGVHTALPPVFLPLDWPPSSSLSFNCCCFFYLFFFNRVSYP